MNIIQEMIIRYNTGKAFTIKKGQYIRIEGTSIVDFVAFNLNNLRERFDQSRTKVNQGKIYISKGDKLISKFNNTMFTITEDTHKDGRHDLQYGMCSKERVLRHRGNLPSELIPDHGCWENLSDALKEWKIAPEDIPSPFNIFQTVEVNGMTGKITNTKIKPKPGTHIDLRAEMDCLIAISACPTLSAGGGDDLKIVLYEK